MLKNISIYMTALLLFVQVSFGQKSAHPDYFRNIILTGRVTDSLIEQNTGGMTTVTVQISRYPFSHAGMQGTDNSIYEMDVKYNEPFRFIIRAPAKRLYMYIGYKQNFQGANAILDMSWSIVDNVYILDEGDCIDADLGRDYFRFAGKGSDKLNCESEIYKHSYNGRMIPAVMSEKLAELSNQGKYREKDSLFSHKRDSCLLIQKAIVEKYRSKLGSELSDILLANCYGIRYYWELRGDRQVWDNSPERHKELIQSNAYKQIRLNLNWRPDILVQSPIYVDALFEKIRFENYFDSRGIFNMHDYYQRIFNTIETNYIGIVKDKLLALFFIISSQFSDSTAYLDTALKQCSPSIFRDVLISLKNTRSKNTTFYPFALPDTKGKIITMASLNNKVVILDFWFTGCENCLILHQKMKMIHEKYKNNHKVSFVSVSIDKNKQMWLNSVNSDKYTNPKDINLYTAGRGLNDPLIVKYSISGFPALFVLANGRVFSTEPPRPVTDKASKDFVGIVEAAIASHSM